MQDQTKSSPFAALLLVSVLATAWLPSLRANAVEDKAAPKLDGKEFVESSPADATIDLETVEGVKLVAAQWRYSDTKIIEVDFKLPDKTPDKTYDYTPHAGVANFDDSKWEVLDPTTLKKPRSTGKMCFNWYRINLTIPDQVGNFKTAGSTVTFETTIDDYAEIWVDGILYRTVGQGGGSVVRGFNTPNRLIIGKNVQPGQHIQLAVFGINGPISAAPDNWIFMRMAHLNFYKPHP
jgi:gluconolactonase